MRRGILSVVAATVTVIGLLGCVGPQPLPTLPPSPSSTPIFASEEEALAAAEDAYAAYLEMSNLISSEGGVDPERIAPFVTEDRLETELRGFATARENQLRIVGGSAFELIEVQRVEIGEDAEVAFYACWDGSASRVIDASGTDVTPDNRVERAVLEVNLRTVGGALPFVLVSDDAWPERSC